MSQCRVVLFGDPQGIPQLLPSLRGDAEIVALVQASIRPAQRAELSTFANAVAAPLLRQPLPRAADYQGFLEDLKTLKPDLFVINSYSMILHPDLLTVPARGTINIHGALLPQYRGANVTEWALINEERVSGVTMHVVDAGVDTGPIIGQIAVLLDFEDTWTDVRRRINEATRELIAEHMPHVLAGDYSASPQGEGRHWPRRSAKDGCFHWQQPLRQIYNLVRALISPHPGVSWMDPDGTAGTLDRWASLAELAVMKASRAGGWNYPDVQLLPKPPLPEARRREANSTMAFDVRNVSAASCGTVTVRDIDCYGRSAAFELCGCENVAEQATFALTMFLRDELQIEHVKRIAALH